IGHARQDAERACGIADPVEQHLGRVGEANPRLAEHRGTVIEGPQRDRPEQKVSKPGLPDDELAVLAEPPHPLDFDRGRSPDRSLRTLPYRLVSVRSRTRTARRTNAA